MLDCATFHDAMARHGVGFFAGVPDSLLKDYCAWVTAHTAPSRHVITANEGSAIALATGHYLATGQLSCVYMQNSGLGNTVNPLTSLADPAVYGIPMLLVVGWRGEPGKKDEPQHVKMGEVTPLLLDACGVPHAVLPDDMEAADAVLERAATYALEHNAPFALVVRKGTFSKFSLPAQPTAYPMTREEAIGALLSSLPADGLVVSTTGKPSRELFELREARSEPHDTDFLTVGCMGHASQIALGVALAKPDRQVYCFDGDGAVLMHMGGLASIGSLQPSNYRHICLNNGAHDSVGGQPTVAFDVDLSGVAEACGYRTVLRANTAAELADVLTSFHTSPGPVFIEVRVAQGARDDLGRPSMTPADLKVRFGNAARS